MTHKYIILSDENDPNALRVVHQKTNTTVVSGISEPRNKPTARETLAEANRIRSGLEQSEAA